MTESRPLYVWALTEVESGNPPIKARGDAEEIMMLVDIQSHSRFVRCVRVIRDDYVEVPRCRVEAAVNALDNDGSVMSGGLIHRALSTALAESPKTEPPTAEDLAEALREHHSGICEECPSCDLLRRWDAAKGGA